MISFLDNGAIDSIVNEPVSSALYVSLDVVAMKATVFRRYMRPVGGSTNAEGICTHSLIRMSLSLGLGTDI